MLKRRLLLVSSLLPWAAAHAQWPSGEGEYRIQQALYGTAERHVDVTDKLREIARGDLRVPLSNELFGVDPDRGRVKQLRIYARGADGRSRVFEYAEGALIDGAFFSGWGRGDWGQGRGNAGWGGRPGYQDGRDGEYRILQARYGTLARSVDVTQRLRELAAADQRFRLANETFGVDPARGELKALRISARRGDGPVRVFEYVEGSEVDGSQFSGWAGGDWGPQRGGGLQILSAEYGAGGRRIDISARLQQQLRDGRLRLRVDNASAGGDPAPGERKQLQLRYRLNGREQTRVVNEGQTLSLP